MGGAKPSLPPHRINQGVNSPIIRFLLIPVALIQAAMGTTVTLQAGRHPPPFTSFCSDLPRFEEKEKGDGATRTPPHPFLLPLFESNKYRIGQI